MTLVKPIPPTKKTKYRDIGAGYASTADGAINAATGELGSRIDIVPYTSTGERDVLGLNTIECLDGIKSLLTEAQGLYAGYEEICDAEDQKVYDAAYAAYKDDLRDYWKQFYSEQ